MPPRTSLTSSAPRRGIHVIAAAALTSFALLATGCASTPPVAAPTATSAAGDISTTLQAVLDDTRTEGGFPGVIARVITPDWTWDGASGTTGASTPVAPAPNDKARIGSVTKTMTATVLLQLVDEGLLSLDDTVSKYIAGIPNGDVATLRQVADMTSGIPSYSLNEQWQKTYFENPNAVWNSDQLVDAARSMPPSFAPGDGWEYSNTNFMLLGVIFEQVLDKPVAEIFEERIFEPLGMNDTSFPAGSSELTEPHLFGITEQGQPDGVTTDATFWSPSFAFTAGEVISTIDDLEKWAHALFTGEGVLSPEMQQLRRDSILRSPEPNNANSGYGIGWGDKDNWWGHTGEIPGFNTAIYHNYDTDTTVLIIVNSDIAMASGAPVTAVYNTLIAALP